jgi:hypothetical protein
MKLVEDLLTRQNVAEDLAVNQRVFAGLRLASEQLKIVQDTLAATVSGILEQYRDAIKLLIDKYTSE